MKISHTDVSEYETHKFSAFASDLGIRPGQWPERIDTDLGNGQPFVFRAFAYDDEDDITHATYAQSLGCIILTIYND